MFVFKCLDMFKNVVRLVRITHWEFSRENSAHTPEHKHRDIFLIAIATRCPPKGGGGWVGLGWLGWLGWAPFSYFVMVYNINCLYYVMECVFCVV